MIRTVREPQICCSLTQCAQLFVTPWTAAHQTSLSFTIWRSLLKLMSIELVMPSNYFIVFYPLLLLPSTFPSIRVFSNKSALWHQVSKYWRKLQFQHQSFRWIFRGDFWFDLVVQRTVKSLSQHHSSDFSILKTSIFWCSAFFTVQLSHPYRTTGKTIESAKTRLEADFGSDHELLLQYSDLDWGNRKNH